MRAHPGAQSGQNLAHDGIAVRREPVMHPFPVPPRLHQTGAPQESEVARDLWLIEAQGIVQIADADLAGREKIQQTQSRPVGQGLEEKRRVCWLLFFHRKTYTRKRIFVESTFPSFRAERSGVEES